MVELNTLNIASFRQLSVGQLIVIERKADKRKIVCQIHALIDAGGREVVLSGKNDYFNWDMYEQGNSWVWRVWAMPKCVELTAITNNFNEFPR